MGTYVGLDVSLKTTSVCILGDDGSPVFEGKVATEPAALARLIRKCPCGDFASHMNRLPVAGISA